MPPSRNAPCPCGSGKKYKRCCLAGGEFENAGQETISNNDVIKIAKTALDLGDTARASKVLQPLLEKTKASPEVITLAASVAMRANDYDNACALMARAIKARPNDPNYFYNYGTALSIAGRKTEALEAFNRALKINPDLLIVYPNRGHTLRDLGRSAEAVESYLKVFGAANVDLATMSQILLSMHMFSQSDHQLLFNMHRQLAVAISKANPRLEQNRTIDSGKKIRIGYLSPRFSREIVGYFFKPLFDHHDRERFEVYLYNVTPRTDELTEYFRERADAWIDVGKLSDQAAAQRIVDDGIDVLVDLAGHAPENRIGIMARKPAPVQVSMLDYFDTTGLDTMDYYVSDAFSSPPDSAQQFTEELLLLDQPRLVYEAPDYAPEPVFNTAMDAPLVFGSFNRHHKMVPHVIATWCALLNGVPGSRLVLKGSAFGEADSQTVFLERFAEHGIGAERIEFRGISPHAEMFAEYGDIDIALDTFPYNGGLTTCESLWMGTPVLTLLGERIISRQTAGMLASLEIEGFTASDEEEFVRLGQYWSEHREELLALRQGLRPKMVGSPLTSAASYTADFEQKLLSRV
ncbi:hypothetical protein A3709_11400 [Halioglobus sp. HI00S01]|uniref:O-linked N-acetylglucosamine transferase family protein n=1 Tax=Halioglobus sp. HI00S01 TaxID=1822214 RepID=UPI0007C37DC2|nr:tetratricopeptide repeat protein [Halioglobus sp. HI00S01]KZX50352.1 hypothetical protein A3709_11400 [Halioglobus sp. HI00S01]